MVASHIESGTRVRDRLLRGFTNVRGQRTHGNLVLALRSQLLVVDDSPGHLRLARAVLAPHAEIRVARCLSTAEEVIEAERFDGILVSGNLGGTPSGALSVVRRARARLASGSPALVIGRGARHHVLRAEALGAVVTEKPLTPEAAVTFLELASGSPVANVGPQSALSNVIAFVGELRDRAGLTPTQTDVLVASVFGETREDLRLRLGLSDATLRKHVSTTLQKVAELGVDAATLDRLVAVVLLRATLEEATGRDASTTPARPWGPTTRARVASPQLSPP